MNGSINPRSKSTLLMAGSRAISTPLAYEIGKDAETNGKIYAGE